MKKLITLAIALGISVTASATEFNGTNKSIETQLCVTALEGKKIAMYNKIKASGLSKKHVARSVTCNGKNILAYVEQYGKNPDAMIRMLDNRHSKVSITDLAKNEL